jgi:hypothetical protein
MVSQIGHPIQQHASGHAFETCWGEETLPRREVFCAVDRCLHFFLLTHCSQEACDYADYASNSELSFQISLARLSWVTLEYRVRSHHTERALMQKAGFGHSWFRGGGR